jgi:FAD:protein FMN transferase
LFIKNILSISLFLTPYFGWSLFPRGPDPICTFDGFVMTMDYHIRVEGAQIDKQQIQEIINKTFCEIDQIYNKRNNKSEITKINQLKANETIEISSELENFLELTEVIVKMSEERFDPTIEPLQQLWKDHLEVESVPTSAEIAEVLPAVGWKNLHYGNGKFFKDHDKTSLDLGGIAKGYCVDLLVERIVAAGHSNVFVEWGGEIRIHGRHLDERPWRVFVARLNDLDPQNAIIQIDLCDQSIATSGDYIQNWSVRQRHSETVYFHIIDPKTARPLESTLSSVASATVIASTCLLADALATIAMMHSSIEEAKLWAEQISKKDPNIKFWLVSRNEAISAESDLLLGRYPVVSPYF